MIHGNTKLKQDGVLVLFIKYIWLSIIRSLKWHYFV